MADMTAGGAYGASGGTLVQYAAGAVSLALLVGVGVWGAKLVMRDVSGVPVVQALPGAMRVAPENPGGIVSQDTGFSVNALVESGAAAAPVDVLQLAPETTVVAEDDFVAPVVEEEEVAAATPSLTEATLQVVEDADAEISQPPQSEAEALAVAEQLAALTAPLSETAPAPAVESELRVPEATAAALAAPSAPAPEDIVVAMTPRPVLRPARTAAPAVAASAPEPEGPLVTPPLPAGTRLVQLGAFDSAEIAAAEWARLSSRYGDYLGDKSRVIEAVERNGRTLYRLRVQGFTDGGDTGRLCSALKAKGQDCMPVVVR